MLDTLLVAALDDPDAYEGKWRNLWLCKDGTAFWGTGIRDTKQAALDVIDEYLDGAREIESNDSDGKTPICVFDEEVIPSYAPMVRRRILKIQPFPYQRKFDTCARRLTDCCKTLPVCPGVIMSIV